MMNEAFQIVPGNTQLLVRGGRLLAAHSDRYSRIRQDSVFDAAKAYLRANFPDATFLNAFYSHERTTCFYQLADYKADFMEAYAEAWKMAGLPEENLAKTSPVFAVCTSDTGEYCVTIYPLLRMGERYYPLGNCLAVKHIGAADIDDVIKKMDLCFTRMTKGLDETAALLNTEVAYPVAAMIRAATEAGLVSVAKKALKSLVAGYKAGLYPGESATAFDLYSQLCDIRFTQEFRKMRSSMQLKISENLYRLLKADWAKYDHPGPEEVL